MGYIPLYRPSVEVPGHQGTTGRVKDHLLQLVDFLLEIADTLVSS